MENTAIAHFMHNTAMPTEIISNVVCDSIPELPDFEPERYMGNWYEIAHVDSWFTWSHWTCGQASYTDLDDEGNFKVYNSGQGRFHGPRFGAHGDAKCPADSPLGSCFVKFYAQPW